MLAKEDHDRDAAFHGKSASQKSPYMAMLSKDSKSQQVAADAYFRHWDNKSAKVETVQDREVGGVLMSITCLCIKNLRIGKQSMLV